ncbi:MAG: hypothetical protein NT082_03810 [Chloroflexi bacterium]|nr:hypothetical protein [Chloroflexota bacterium]
MISLFLPITVFALASLTSFVPCLAVAPVNIEPAGGDQAGSSMHDGVNKSTIEVSPEDQSIGLVVNLPRRSFLTGENIQVTVSTNTPGTAMTLYYEINGERTTVTGSTINGSQTFSIKTPERPGPVSLICEGNAIVIYWDVCTAIEVCGYDANNLPRYCTYTYPCQKEMMVYGNTYADFTVYSRNTSISGNVYDSLKNPVNQAKVELSNGSSRVTSSDGFYKFGDFVLGDNYRLAGERPTVDVTMKIDAVACNQQTKSIAVPAEQPLVGIDINLDRVFYPPEIKLTDFTFSAFSGWPEASKVSAWADIVAITSTGTAKLSNINYGGSGLTTTPVGFESFVLGDKNLYLLPNPKMGRYRLDFLVEPLGAFNLYAAANIPGIGQVQGIKVPGKGDKTSEKFSLDISIGSQTGPGCAPQKKFELKPIDIIDLTLVIVIAIAGVLGGLLAAFLILGRRYGWIDKGKNAIKVMSLKRTVTAARKPVTGEQGGTEEQLNEPKEMKQLEEGKQEDNQEKGK